jgi:hypothetical protein
VDANDLFNGSSGLDGAAGNDGRGGGSVLFLDDYLFAVVVVLGAGVGVLVRVVVTVRVDGVLDAVGDLVGGFGDSLTKRVVLAFVVVISHITLLLLGGVDSGTSRFFYTGLGWVAAVNNVVCLTPVRVGLGLGSEGLLGVTCNDGTSAFAELTFGDVELRGCVVGGRAVDCIEVAIVGSVLNLDVGVGGGRRLRMGLITGGGKKVSLGWARKSLEEVWEKWSPHVARTTTNERG